MTDIKSMLLSELQEDFALRGLQKFRAAQVYRWLHQRGATSFDEMTDLSKDLRVALKESFEIRNTEIAIRRVSKIDGTKKYLFRLNDGEMIESVLMKYKHLSLIHILVISNGNVRILQIEPYVSSVDRVVASVPEDVYKRQV